jgi:hypothetical protein
VAVEDLAGVVSEVMAVQVVVVVVEVEVSLQE